MTLRQSHFVPPVSYLLAEDLGFLRGSDVVLTRTTSSAEQLRALLAGEQDMVVTAIDNLFEWVLAGADLRLVAQMEATTPLGIHARRGLETIADLAGCRFAVDAPNNGFALIARRLLRDAGVEVDYRVVGGVRERLDAMLDGEVDATLLGAPFDKLAEKAGFARIVDINAWLPELPGQGLVVRADVVGSVELERYLRALARGVSGWRTLRSGLRERRLGLALTGANAERSVSLIADLALSRAPIRPSSGRRIRAETNRRSANVA